MLVITDPGDEIIVIELFYVNCDGFVSLGGMNLISVASKVENGYALP